jgi:glucose/arabinose dehydrogenase
MKSTTVLGMLTAAAFAATTGSALAQGTQQGTPQQGTQQQQGTQNKAQQREQRQVQSHALAQEQIEGKVVSVDKSKGTLSVDTQQHGQLEFKLTPAQVQNMSEGEQDPAALDAQAAVRTNSKKARDRRTSFPRLCLYSNERAGA